ncbi:hypothetical protein [Peribacillus frigoritolerans]|uniref:hypothetical protein n=1 Tax=Peribacillus frigoritolerans TaxID=450367 RepID=UPI00207A6CBC|nr:hypothetical protein [Peribacillus frigoritolerans]USK72797.1 hypothetical protein LIT31_12905 [Peribacillus frigoritolerans]
MTIFMMNTLIVTFALREKGTQQTNKRAIESTKRQYQFVEHAHIYHGVQKAKTSKEW